MSRLNDGIRRRLDAERLERAQEQAERAPDLYGEGPEYDGFVWTDEDEDYSAHVAAIARATGKGE